LTPAFTRTQFTKQSQWKARNPCKTFSRKNNKVKFESAEYTYQVDSSKFNREPLPINKHFYQACKELYYIETEGQKPIPPMTSSFNCRVEMKANPPPVLSAEKSKEDKFKARLMKIQEEALHTLHEIATYSHNRPIHTTSHKLDTMLHSYMQQIGISQRDAEQS
jgi:hypothetical protein